MAGWLGSWTTAYRRPCWGGVFLLWAALGARARCTILHCCFLGGCFFFGGVRGGLITFLAGRLTRYSLGLAATLSTLLLHCTLNIADIRKERWPSQNEPRCAINDPAMDLASNNFAVFSQRIDVTPCRSDEETS